MEESKMEMEELSANLKILDQHLHDHGLKRFQVPPDGHCIIHSWRIGLEEAGSVFNNTKDLLDCGIKDILKNLSFYKEFLPNEDLKHQLEAYALLHNYHSAVVDLMVHALANATCTTCIVLSARCGEVRTTKIDPREGKASKYIIRVCKVGPHYDAVVDKATTPNISGTFNFYYIANYY